MGYLPCRYELEKELLEGTVNVPNLPMTWSERMTSYLGCAPKDDAQGVLQASSSLQKFFFSCIPHLSSHLSCNLGFMISSTQLFSCSETRMQPMHGDSLE